MKASVFTLGCKVNDCESGSLIEGLERAGWEVAEGLVPADVYILNTCAVTAEAEKKSRQAVARIRKVNPEAKIIVCGCAAEKTPAVFAEKENVTVVSGARQKGKILGLLNEKGIFLDENDKEYDELPAPKRFKSRAFVKIQDGCNNFCSYCIIPYLRGRSRSRRLESAAEEILSCTAEEAVITGIDISSYDDGGRGLADLLLAVKDARCRIRLGSLEAGVITEHLLEAAKQVRRFAPHFHLSLQSGSDAVLKKMNRHYTVEQYLELIEYARKTVPGITFSSDIIVGFPGETEEDFVKTLELVQKVGYMQLFTFIYSKRTGTKAADMPDPTPRKEKTDRMTRLLKVQDEIAMALVKAQVGQTVKVLVEGFGRNEGTLSGRLDNNLTVEFTADASLMGSYANVHLTGARATVLLGELA